MSVADLERLARIEQFDVLGRPPLEDLEAVVELAARVCEVPLATINLITATEQHQVAVFGFDAGVCRREDSMCAAVLDADTPVIVPDATEDPRFRDNPFVTGELAEVRFYASHTLVGTDGVVVGTLCVFDTEVRHLSDFQVRGLSILATAVVDVLELRASQRRLAESNQRLSVFARRVSHDLKGPLNTLTLAMGLMRDQVDEGRLEPADAARLLDRALAGTERMNAMIDDVLRDAAAGAAGPSAEPVDLGVLVREVLGDLDGVLAGDEVDVAPLPVVPGQAVQLRAALQNLLDNAAKYRRHDRGLQVRVTADEVPRGWRISIADNGIGVPEDDRARVFGVGERAGNHRAEGQGIGLDTTRRVVEAHLGRVGVEPTPGGGATFWLELPARVA